MHDTVGCQKIGLGDLDSVDKGSLLVQSNDHITTLDGHDPLSVHEVLCQDLSGSDVVREDVSQVGQLQELGDRDTKHLGQGLKGLVRRAEDGEWTIALESVHKLSLHGVIVSSNFRR